MIQLLEGEIFVPVVGFHGYEISNKGRLKSCAKTWMAGRKNSQLRTKEDTLCPPHYDWQGYNHQTIRKDNKGYDIKVCKLVAKHFIPNPLNKKCVNHLDGNKANDDVANLEWATHKENTIHAHKTGLSKPKNGSQNGMSVLKESDVINIRNSTLSANDLSKQYSVTSEHIKSIIKKRVWKHI